MKSEIRRAGMKLDAKRIDDAEQKQEFKEVESRFKVIDSQTEIAVVKKKLKQRLVNRERVTFQELQDGSVQIYSNRKVDFAIAPIVKRPGVYEWTLDYDMFIGYMAGVIDNVDLLDSGAAFA
jgi:CRISPR-associated endonuclease/helicase Cas3